MCTSIFLVFFFKVSCVVLLVEGGEVGVVRRVQSEQQQEIKLYVLCVSLCHCVHVCLFLCLRLCLCSSLPALLVGWSSGLAQFMLFFHLQANVIFVLLYFFFHIYNFLLILYFCLLYFLYDFDFLG